MAEEIKTAVEKVKQKKGEIKKEPSKKKVKESPIKEQAKEEKKSPPPEEETPDNLAEIIEESIKDDKKPEESNELEDLLPKYQTAPKIPENEPGGAYQSQDNAYGSDPQEDKDVLYRPGQQEPESPYNKQDQERRMYESSKDKEDRERRGHDPLAELLDNYQK